jgi:hypothetical protein
MAPRSHRPASKGRKGPPGRPAAGGAASEASGGCGAYGRPRTSMDRCARAARRNCTLSTGRPFSPAACRRARGALEAADGAVALRPISTKGSPSPVARERQLDAPSAPEGMPRLRYAGLGGAGCATYSGGVHYDQARLVHCRCFTDFDFVDRSRAEEAAGSNGQFDFGGASRCPCEETRKCGVGAFGGRVQNGGEVLARDHG